LGRLEVLQKSVELRVVNITFQLTLTMRTSICGSVVPLVSQSFPPIRTSSLFSPLLGPSDVDVDDTPVVQVVWVIGVVVIAGFDVEVPVEFWLGVV
jgi:hypothetical protein